MTAQRNGQAIDAALAANAAHLEGVGENGHEAIVAVRAQLLPRIPCTGRPAASHA